MSEAVEMTQILGQLESRNKSDGTSVLCPCSGWGGLPRGPCSLPLTSTGHHCCLENAYSLTGPFQYVSRRERPGVWVGWQECSPPPETYQGKNQKIAGSC
jgi:hypothetical protein